MMFLVTKYIVNYLSEQPNSFSQNESRLRSYNHIGLIMIDNDGDFHNLFNQIIICITCRSTQNWKHSFNAKSPDQVNLYLDIADDFAFISLNATFHRSDLDRR